MYGPVGANHVWRHQLLLPWLQRQGDALAKILACDFSKHDLGHDFCQWDKARAPSEATRLVTCALDQEDIPRSPCGVGYCCACSGPDMAHGRRSSALQRDCLLSGGYPTRQRGSSEPPAATESDPQRTSVSSLGSTGSGCVYCVGPSHQDSKEAHHRQRAQ
jgi:hypothetical protein